MRCDALALSLLEFLAYKAGCPYLSDLPRVSGWQRVRMARELEHIPAESASLHDWNDALEYLAQAPPEATPQAARRRLLERLNLWDTLSQGTDR